MSGIDRPVPTEEFGRLDDFRPQTGSAFVYAASSEQRSLHRPEWEVASVGVDFYAVLSQSLESMEVEVAGSVRKVGLRSQKAIASLVSYFDTERIYLDITGLQHSTWAPLVRSWVQLPIELRVVYREPAVYNHRESPTEGKLFELSDDFLGIRPLPGFAPLATRNSGPACFVPLLGFEGPRLARLVEEMEPASLSVIPIVGVPGFRPDYPYNAILGNRLPLEQIKGWPHVRYAKANCPFSLLYLLEKIAAEHVKERFVVGLIGTKPHALGAILFAMRTSTPVELLHDHPVRSAKRTSGTDRVLVYHVSTLEYSSL